MHLLGGVDQQEEQREGARHRRRELERQALHAREQSSARFGAPASPRRRARHAPQPLHGVESVVALQPADHAAEAGGEAAHVVVQGLVFGANVDASHAELFP